MEIEFFIESIESTSSFIGSFTRGNIIDSLAYHKDNWILVLKALLIKNPTKYIDKTYLLSKLNFMKDNPEHQENFLDLQGTVIYNALRDG